MARRRLTDRQRTRIAQIQEQRRERAARAAEREDPRLDEIRWMLEELLERQREWFAEDPERLAAFWRSSHALGALHAPLLSGRPDARNSIRASRDSLQVAGGRCEVPCGDSVARRDSGLAAR